MANYHNQQPPVGLSHPPSMPFPIYQTQTQTHTQTQANPQGPHQDAPASTAYQFNAIPPSPTFGAMGASAPQFPSFWNHFQNGGFPPVLPPFIGPNGYPIPPPFPPNLNISAPPAPSAPSLAHPQHNISPVPMMLDRVDTKGRIAEVQEVDKEEGEVSENDNSSPHKIVNHHSSPNHASDATNLDIPQSHGTIPTKIPNSQGEPREWPLLSKTDMLHNRPSITSQPRHQVPPAGDPSNPMDLSTQSPQSQDRKQAKDFLVVLHQSKYGLSDILREKIDAGPLVEIWQEAGLPVNSNDIIYPSATASPERDTADVIMRDPSPVTTPAISVSPKVPEVVTVPAPVIPSIKKTPAQNVTPIRSPLELPPKPSSSSSSARQTESKVSAAGPADRTAYIARLMAAKSMKSGPSSKPNQSEPAVPVQPVAKTVSSGSVVSHGPPVAPRVVHPVPSALPSKVQITDKSTSISSRPKQHVQPTVAASTVGDDVESVAEIDRKKKLQNELIRRKMAMLQAAKAARAPPVAMSSSSLVTDATRAATPSPQRSESPLYGDEVDTSKPSPEVYSTSTQPGLSTPKQSSSTVQMNGNGSAGIPGLFMHDGTLQPSNEKHSSNEKSGVSNVVGISAAIGGNRRKRPVASDFDNNVSSVVSPSAFKRPFGQSKQVHDDEEMIIEVSDDETAASGMDLDDSYDDSMNGAIYAQAYKQKASKNMPMLSHPLPKPMLQSSTPSLPASGMSTPLAVQTPGSSSSKTNVNLSEHEKQIQDLRRRIAEAEKRKNAKKPQPFQEVDASQLLDEVANNLESTQKIMNRSASLLRDDTGQDANLNMPHQEAPSKSVTANGITPPLGSATPPLHQQTSDWRKRRREEIQSGLQLQNLTVARNMARLEQLRREMERLEAENLKQIEDKENLVKELESLGIDTEGMPHDVLQATMDEIVQQREVAAAAERPEEHSSDETVEAPESNDERLIDAGDDDLYDDDQNVAVPATDDHTHIPFQENNQVPAPIDISTVCRVEPDPVPVQARSFSMVNDSPTDADTSMDMDEVDSVDSITKEDEFHHHPGPDMVKDSVPEEYVRSGSSVKDDSEDDFYSPGPAEAQEATGKEDQPVPTHAEQSDDYLRELSPMSQDGEDDDDEVAMAISEHSDYDPMDLPIEQFSAEAQHHSNDYKPVNELPDIPPSKASSHDSDVSTPSSSDSEDSEALFTEVQDALLEAADVIASGTLDQNVDLMEVSSSAVPISVPPPEKSHYTPYDSPLRRFKAFRYHPDFSKNVAGGFRSMTFSHQIDPLTPLCPFEASGGACNDKGCTNQHFQGMELSDDMILVQLGTTNPGRNDQEKQEWTEGLRGILKELRQKNTKDPDIVATAIANYRRTFLKDPTKVLNI